MTEQRTTPIPEEWKLTDEEIETATCDPSKTHYGVNWQYLSVADAAVAKCAPLIEKKAREEECLEIKKIMREANDLKELEKMIADYLGQEGR